MDRSRAIRFVVAVVTVAVWSAIGAVSAAVAVDTMPSRYFPDHQVGSSTSDVVVIPLAHATLGTFERVRVPRTSCPDEAPILERTAYHSTEEWRIPDGVQVNGVGGELGLYAHIIGFSGDVSTPGWVGDGISVVVNWSREERTVDVRMICVKPWDTTVQQEFRVGAHQIVTGLGADCPADAPYLVDSRSTLPRYEGWQYVFASGVRIEDHGFVIGDAASRGAILRAAARNANGYQTGIADLTIIARAEEKVITVTLFCTDSTTDAARW